MAAAAGAASSAAVRCSGLGAASASRRAVARPAGEASKPQRADAARRRGAIIRQQDAPREDPVLREQQLQRIADLLRGGPLVGRGVPALADEQLHLPWQGVGAPRNTRRRGAAERVHGGEERERGAQVVLQCGNASKWLVSDATGGLCSAPQAQRATLTTAAALAASSGAMSANGGLPVNR